MSFSQKQQWRSGNWRGAQKSAVVYPLLATEVNWHSEKERMAAEIKRLRSEVGLITKRYRGTQREVQDLVTRLRAQPPPPVPHRGHTASTAPEGNEEEKEEEESEETDSGEEGEEMEWESEAEGNSISSRDNNPTEPKIPPTPTRQMRTPEPTPERDAEDATPTSSKPTTANPPAVLNKKQRKKEKSRVHAMAGAEKYWDDHAQYDTDIEESREESEDEWENAWTLRITGTGRNGGVLRRILVEKKEQRKGRKAAREEEDRLRMEGWMKVQEQTWEIAYDLGRSGEWYPV